MITFSTGCSIGSPDWLGLTSLFIVPGRSTMLRRADGRGGARRALLAPAAHGAAKLEVGDRAGNGGQPERERPVGENGHDRQSARDTEGDEGADHPAV